MSDAAGPPIERASNTRRRSWWPLWIVLCAAAGLLLRLPALRAQLFFDDFIVVSMFRGELAPRGPLGLEVFASGSPTEHAMLLDKGFVAWWVPPDFKVAPFRPLASLLIWLELAAFGPHAAALHAFGLIWWAALVASASLLFRRTLPRGAAAIALLLYCVAQAHAVPSIWIAAQSGWMATTGACLALWAYFRLREENWKPGLWLTPAFLAVGLLCGEYAIGALGFIASYELCVAADDAKSRLRAWAPIIALLTVYVVAYKALGRGAHAAPGYIDPLREPTRFFGRLVASVGLLVREGALGLDRSPGLSSVIVLAGAIGFLATLTLCLREKKLRLAWFLTLGAVLAFVPTVGAPFGSRLLLMPSLGFVGAAALALAGAIESLRASAPRISTRGRHRAIAGAVLASLLTGSHLVAGGGACYAETARTSDSSLLLYRAAMTVPPSLRRQRVLLAAPDPFSRGYAALVAEPHGNGGAHGWYPLSPHELPHELLRTDERTLEIAIRAPFLRAPFVDGVDIARLDARSPVRTGPLVIELLQLDPETRIRVHFDEPLERYQLLVSRGTAFGEVSPPAIGKKALVVPAH